MTVESSILITFDSSVLVAAARSRLGASHAIISSIPSTRFQVAISVGLFTEWMAVLTRPENLPPQRTTEDVVGFLRYLASQSVLQEIHFLWRPFLQDPNDDMVLELAFAARCRYILTHNLKHFRGCEQLGVTAITPRDFMKLQREIP